ncbi:DUF6731 family protein [Solibacillus sp. FSL H8-0523]|uniref:DUF6731 family protein n=1 Tax=Solibacillus sp. FSL H8-0523 TaxID=2954511 RepID=UPI003100CFF7
MVKKYVRFNYFSINMVPESIPTSMGNRTVASAWDMKELLDYLSVTGNQLDSVIDVGEYVAEFERETLIYDSTTDIYSFQLGKMRATGIPSLKTIGQPKKDIRLKDDEFIGEFVTIIFDPTFCTVGIQSNRYSLNVKQVELYLTELRARYNNLVGRIDGIPLKVEFQPILDIARAQTIGSADIFRKLTIKGTDAMADALARQGVLGEISEVIGQARGINFELTISLGQAPKSESLDNGVIREVIQGFHQMDEKDRPKVEIVAREEEAAALEVINLAAPTLTNIITLEVVERKGIGHEYIHQMFKEKYPHVRGRIAAINVPLEA